MMLEESKALPFFAALLELESGKHSCLALENVMGLCHRTYQGSPCIRVVESQLRTAASGRYFLCISKGVSPHLFGELTHRPRVLFRLVRKDVCLAASEEDFVHTLEAVDAAIMDRSRELASTSSSGHPQSFCQRLQQKGHWAGTTMDPEAAPPIGQCPCCLPFTSLQARRTCPHHRCKCRACRGGTPRSCRWAHRHATRWAELVARGAAPAQYVQRATKARLFLDELTSPRERNLAELVACDLALQGMDCLHSDAIFDVTQSYGRHALRWDGLVPTITTTSRLFVMRWGRCLILPELFALMGFPIRAYTPFLGRFSYNQLLRFVGNTMHPAMMGACLYSMLCLIKLEDCTSGDEGSD